MVWQQKAWLAEVEQWLKEKVAVVGKIEQIHASPWATVLRVPTAQRDLYFKASTIKWETAVTATLARLQPYHLPQIIAANTQRNWLLMADGGSRIRESFGTEPKQAVWLNILANYANFQIALAAHTDELLQAGAYDRRLAQIPKLYEWLLAETEWLLIGEADSLNKAEYKQLVTAIPQVESLCQQLARFNIPASIHHNDLHDGNVFVASGETNGRYLFFDWGDSSLSHPFFSLRTAFVSIEGRFNLNENDPIFDTFAQAYLNPWRVYESDANLWTAYQLARQLWSISSAIKYKTQLQPLGSEKEDYVVAVPILLQEFLASLKIH